MNDPFTPCTEFQLRLMKGKTMRLIDYFREGLLDNMTRLSHNIYCERPKTSRFLINPLGKVQSRFAPVGSNISEININGLSHNICCGRPKNPLFLLTPLAFVIATKIVFYMLATSFVLFNLYLLIVFGCLLDDQCYAMHFGGYHG